MDFFDTVGALALASRLKRLSDTIMAEGRIIYRAAGFDFEPRWFPLFFLLRQQQITVTDAARMLGVPHPYVSQLAKEMRHAKLIHLKRNPADGRSRILVLSPKGRSLAAELEPLWTDFTEAATTVIRHTQSDVLGTLKSMENFLKATPLSEIVSRLRASRLAQPSPDAGGPPQPTEPVHVRRIEQGDNTAMASVIRTVMTELGASGPGFSIHDDEVDRMYEAYAGPHARYFVVVAAGRVVGGGGIAPLAGGDASVCELKKMHVLPEARGIGAGRELLTHCLEAARECGYATCYLETHHSMRAAHKLYERAGFTRIAGPLGHTGHFSCDMFYVKALGAAQDESSTFISPSRATIRGS